MAEHDIVQNLIVQLGQSQRDRLAPELRAHHADVDERTPEDLLRFTARFAPLVRFFAGEAPYTAGDWTPLFPTDVVARVAADDRRVAPHLALYQAFVALYQVPRARANEITGRHLDFCYGDVLQLRRRAPTPDRAHVVIELKKNAPAIAIGPAQRFSAGKDADGVELRYAPTTETVVNTSRVDMLRSTFVDRTGGHGTVRFAPIANSADGLGGKLPPDEPSWRAFGDPSLPRAEVGFAVASPVLRMQEGAREITLRLRLTGVDAARLTTSRLAGAFAAYVTGAKGWIEPDAVTTTLGADGVLTCALTLPESAPPVVDYDAALHGYTYAAAAPIVQLLLRGDASVVGYLDFAGVVVGSVRVTVDVSTIGGLTLESDVGALDAKKAFLPFGPMPTVGSRFMIAYPEALAKKLSQLRLTIGWKDAPQDLGARYAAYGNGATNRSFTASVVFRDGSGTVFTEHALELFDAADARGERTFTFTASGASATTAGSAGLTVRALHVAGAAWSTREARRRVSASPVLGSVHSYLHSTPAPPTGRGGFVTLTLNHGFLHAEYRKCLVETALAYGKSDGSAPPVMPNEPYAPSVQHIALAYRASSDDVAISSDSAADFANPDVQFFQIAPFGPRREHGYQRRRFAFVDGPDVPLLPPFPADGELLIGLTGLHADDSVSLLFEVAAGSADPDLVHEPVRWSVLCDDYWRPLGAQELVRDTTNDLLASGIVRIIVPAEATTEHTMLPTGRVWIRAAVAREVAAVSRLIDVVANGVEVRLVEGGSGAAHLASALPARRIARLTSPVAAVKAVTQPAASFGGSALELDETFRTRVSERLRHKDRCITPWDYERIVLEAFPAVHRVKCVPHARDGSWAAPGHVLLVVVPDLRNRNAVDPLRPRVDADTLSRIAAHVQARAGMQVRVTVKNPRYQKVRLDFGVRFRIGADFNHSRDTLQAAVIRALSPWAFEAERDIAFGGTIYRSVLLDVVEKVPYVDFVTDFRMYSFVGDVVDATDRDEVRPVAPDAILISDATHAIVAAA